MQRAARLLRCIGLLAFFLSYFLFIGFFFVKITLQPNATSGISTLIAAGVSGESMIEILDLSGNILHFLVEQQLKNLNDFLLVAFNLNNIFFTC